MDQFINEWRGLAEFISFAAAPLIFLVAIVSLYQIKIAKNSILITAKREATRISVEVCEKTMGEVILVNGELTDYLKRSSISLPEVSENSVTCIDSVKGNQLHTDLLNGKHQEIGVLGTKLFNLLENFSYYVLSGVADAESAYWMEGYTFLKIVKDRRFLLCSMRESSEDHIYSCIVKLETAWRNDETAEMLEKSLNETAERLKAVKRTRIGFIGQSR